MPFTTFPVVGGTGVHAVGVGGDTDAKHPPGTIQVLRTGDQFTVAQYLQLDNNGISQGEVAVVNFATLKQYSCKKAATSDSGAPMVGIALATVSSQKFGWFAIGGYCEKADLSHTAASGEYLRISGSTAGKLTPDIASVFNGATVNTSGYLIVAVSKAALATGVGSVAICGMWGAG